MNVPNSVYYFSHCHINPKTGTTGTRWDYVKHEGVEQRELTHTMTRKPDAGIKKIDLNKPIQKKGSTEKPEGLILANPSMKKYYPERNGSVSKVHSPDTENPKRAYGDINERRDTILLKIDWEAGTMKIMVFEGVGRPQSEILFQNWATGGVSESVPNNRLKLNTDSVMKP